jgi:prophage DNA circulation protein
MADGPSYFDGLPKTSFAGIEFPAERIVLHSNGRQHVHEYPHAPGGAPEKLGRGIYYLTVTGNFTGGANNFKSYPGLYPDRMNQLRALYESQTTDTFVHPTVGQFQAFISKWSQEYLPGKYRSGEKVEIEFLEDQRTSYLVQKKESSGLAIQIQNLNVTAGLALPQLVPAVPPNVMGLFSAINATVNAVLALADQATLYTQLYASKIQELLDLCKTVDSYCSRQGPAVVGIVDALHDLMFSAIQLSQQVRSQNPLSDWTVEYTTTLADIAMQIYGDASRQSDLLTLNANTISDPTRVQAGTQLLYYPA